jgi:hypothetical protein
MSKGSKRRPTKTPKKDVDAAWDKLFPNGSKQVPDFSYLKNIAEREDTNEQPKDNKYTDRYSEDPNGSTEPE